MTDDVAADPAPDTLALVKLYTGTVVSDVARALAVIAIDTRVDPGDTISEATKTALRVTEAARLLCGVKPDQPLQWISPQEEAKLRELFDQFTPAGDDDD